MKISSRGYGAGAVSFLLLGFFLKSFLLGKPCSSFGEYHCSNIPITQKTPNNQYVRFIASLKENPRLDRVILNTKMAEGAEIEFLAGRKDTLLEKITLNHPPGSFHIYDKKHKITEAKFVIDMQDEFMNCLDSIKAYNQRVKQE